MMVGTDGRMAHVPSSNREWEYGRCHMLGPERPEAVLRDRAFCLPTFSHFLIVNKTSLSLSVCLSTGRNISLCYFISKESAKNIDF